MADKPQRLRAGVSPATDELAAELLADGLDRLAAGEAVNVLLAVQDGAGAVASYEFADDGPEACLAAAHARIGALVGAQGDAEAALAAPVRCALLYEGAVADEDGVYQDALILEFGERGWRSYSGYSLFQGRGAGDALAWTDPAPAGELDPLL